MRKQKKKHTVLKVILLIVLILLLVATGGAFWVYQKFSDTVGEMNYRELESDKLEINQQVKENKALKGYTNIALFGLDSREGNLEQANSDTIIIASINNDTKEIKMVSVYRDTYLNIGNDMYRKANAAYANGGPEWAVSMLNTNLGTDPFGERSAMNKEPRTMQMADAAAAARAPEDTPAMVKKIGKTTYKVHVHLDRRAHV